MPDIAEEHIQGRQDKGKSQGEGELEEDDEGQEKQRKTQLDLEQDQGGHQDDKGQQELNQVGQDYGEGEDFSGKINLFHQVGVVLDRAYGHGEGETQEHPWQKPAEEKEGKILHSDLDDVFEGNGIDDQHDQRIEERPKKT